MNDVELVRRAQDDCARAKKAATDRLVALEQRRKDALLRDDSNALDSIERDIASEQQAIKRQDDRAALLNQQLVVAQHKLRESGLDRVEAHERALEERLATAMDKLATQAAEIAETIAEIDALDGALESVANRLIESGRRRFAKTSSVRRSTPLRTIPERREDRYFYRGPRIIGGSGDPAELYPNGKESLAAGDDPSHWERASILLDGERVVGGVTRKGIGDVAVIPSAGQEPDLWSRNLKPKDRARIAELARVPGVDAAPRQSLTSPRPASVPSRQSPLHVDVKDPPRARDIALRANVEDDEGGRGNLIRSGQ